MNDNIISNYSDKLYNNEKEKQTSIINKNLKEKDNLVIDKTSLITRNKKCITKIMATKNEDDNDYTPEISNQFIQNQNNISYK